MVEMKKLNIETKTELFYNYIIELLNNGFKVYAYDSNKKGDINKTWVMIVKNDNIGSIEENYFSGLNFSTVHKANRTTGAGYRMITEVIKPTIENAESTFCLCPDWARDSEIESIIKFKNWKDYTKRESVLKYKEVKFIKCEN